MRIFLDTANIEEIRQGARLGVISGVTTNPSLVAKEKGVSFQSVIKEMMDRVMNKVLKEDPFLIENHHAEKPLYAALVPDEIFKGSHFERRFVTPFGKAWEKLAIVAAAKA